MPKENYYRLIPTEPLLRDSVSINSKEGTLQLVLHVADELKHFSWPAFAALENLIYEIYSDSGAHTVVFVERVEHPVGRIFDVFILWATPISIESHEQGEHIEALTKLHEDLRQRLDPSLDSLLHLITPTRPYTPAQFEASMLKRLPTAQSVRVLGSATTQKIPPRKFFRPRS